MNTKRIEASERRRAVVDILWQHADSHNISSARACWGVRIAKGVINNGGSAARAVAEGKRAMA